jgi:hypothetical protein
MQVRKVLSLFCFMLMNSLLLFSTCPKSTPNGSLISNLATERGTFKVLAKSARTYILGHHGRYITVVDTENCLSALCLSNQTTLRAIRILANLKSPLRFTVDFQVKDPALRSSCFFGQRRQLPLHYACLTQSGLRASVGCPQKLVIFMR